MSTWEYRNQSTGDGKRKVTVKIGGWRLLIGSYLTCIALKLCGVLTMSWFSTLVVLPLILAATIVAMWLILTVCFTVFITVLCGFRK